MRNGATFDINDQSSHEKRNSNQPAAAARSISMQWLASALSMLSQLSRDSNPCTDWQAMAELSGD